MRLKPEHRALLTDPTPEFLAKVNDRMDEFVVQNIHRLDKPGFTELDALSDLVASIVMGLMTIELTAQTSPDDATLMFECAKAITRVSLRRRKGG